MIENYSSVRLLTNKHRSEGASAGDVGSVIEVYDNGDYEVEFANEDGIDFAQIVARENELQVVKREPPASTARIKITSTTVAETTEISPPSGTPQRNKQPSLK